MKPAAVLQSIGVSLPERRVDNEELASTLGVDAEWVVRRTGIEARYHVRPGESTSDLATAAARIALSRANDCKVDTVIVATATPDHQVPGCAPVVAHRLGLGTVAAFDLAAVCTGFVYGLSVAKSLILSGASECVLLIGADVFSTILDLTDLKVAPLFGDGAGAVILRKGRSSDPGALHAITLGSDGAGHDHIIVPAGGSRCRDSQEPGDRYLKLKGLEVFQAAVKRMAASCQEVLAAQGWDEKSVDWVIGHQANKRILRSLGFALRVPEEKVIIDVDRVGNTSAASIPLAMHTLVESGRANPGQNTLLTGFGGGLTWGAVALNWPDFKNRMYRDDGQDSIDCL